MFMYPIFADAGAFEEEFTALKHALNMSYYSAYVIVLLIVIALIINHIKHKKLLLNVLVPFFVLFALHPAWLLRILKIEKPSTLEISSYVFFGLAVLWFIIFLFIKTKPDETMEKSENAESKKPDN